MGLCGGKKTYAAPAAEEKVEAEEDEATRVKNRRASLVAVQDRYGEDNDRALRVTSQGGNSAAVDTLLRAGADTNSQHRDGWSALMWASMPVAFCGTPDCNESAALHSYGLDSDCRSVLHDPTTGRATSTSCSSCWTAARPS